MNCLVWQRFSTIEPTDFTQKIRLKGLMEFLKSEVEGEQLMLLVTNRFNIVERESTKFRRQ